MRSASRPRVRTSRRPAASQWRTGQRQAIATRGPADRAILHSTPKSTNPSPPAAQAHTRSSVRHQSTTAAVRMIEPTPMAIVTLACPQRWASLW